MKNIGYYNGKTGPIEEMTVPMNDRACYFGDGVYDATAALNHVPMHFDDHSDRIYSSAKLIDIDIPMTKDEMKQMLDKMDNAYLHGEDYTVFDVEFHSIVARCTGNEVIERLLPTIHESIRAGYQHTRRVEGSYQRASQCHLEMYRAIMDQNSDRARQAAQRHMIQTMHDSGVEVPTVLTK